jgi:DNA primase
MESVGDDRSSTGGLLMNNWIDFKELRGKLDFEQLLRHYGVEVKRRGNQHHGFCPLPNHIGKKNSPSFSAQLEKGIFQCFGCGAKGNVLDFAALMEKTDPKDGAALHTVAVELQKRFCPELRDAPQAKKKAAEKPAKPETKGLPVVVNAPLGFDLKGLDAKHPYLLNRGFSQDTIDFFGLGFCSRGMLKERVAIPLHDPDGKLVGYAGRVVDDSTISEDNPRYRLPSKREHDGKLFEFRKTMFLYNGFRFKAPVDDLIVVEGFTGVWWLHQNAWPHVVGLMGADCSERQAELIVSLVKPSGRVWLMPDGNQTGNRNEPGKRCAQSLLMQVSPYRFTRWVKLGADKQPTDLSAEQLKNSFTP